MKISPINSYSENRQAGFKARLDAKTYSSMLSKLPATKSGNDILTHLIEKVSKIGLAGTLIGIGESISNGETSRSFQTTSYGDFITLSTSASRQYELSNPLFGNESTKSSVTHVDSVDYVDGEEEIPREIPDAYVSINESLEEIAPVIQCEELKLYQKFVQNNQKGTALSYLKSILPKLKEQGATKELLEQMLKIANEADKSTYNAQRKIISEQESNVDLYNKQIRDSISE